MARLAQIGFIVLALCLLVALSAFIVPVQAQEKKSALRVIAEPFLLQGTYYLKLSLENQSDKPCEIEDRDGPAWTPEKWFTIRANDKEQKFVGRGSYTISSGGGRKEIPANGRSFFGVVVLAGEDKARLLDGYSPRFHLGPGAHEIEVRSRDAAAAKLKVTIPANIASAADQNIPRTDTPLRFTLTTQATNAGAVIAIDVGNESTELWHYPYRGDTPPWHRSNWYQLEIDCKIVKPDRNIEHKDREGKQAIRPMHRWFAHKLYLVTQKKDRKFADGYPPVYVVAPGEHTVRVIASPLWAEQMTPVPLSATARVRVAGPVNSN
jgi:hypothetical protein